MSSSVKDSETVVDRFLALGGNFIGTANADRRGHSEKITSVGTPPGAIASSSDQVRRHPLPWRSERRWCRPKGDLRSVRRVAPAEDAALEAEIGASRKREA